jgi:hypothetical protein
MRALALNIARAKDKPGNLAATALVGYQVEVTVTFATQRDLVCASFSF